MKDRHLKYVLLLPALLVVGATLLYPLVQAFWYSLHDWNLSRAPTLGPMIGLENYQRSFDDDPDFWKSLTTTLIFCIASVSLTLVLAFALALLLAGTGRLETSVRTLLVIPFAMSPALVGVSWRFLLNPEFGAIAASLKTLPPLREVQFLADPNWAMAALVASDVWHWTPYFMLTFVGALATLPQETIDAARVDGATGATIIFKIILPQLWPVVAIAILLKTIFSLKALDQVVTLTSGGPGQATETVSHFIYQTAFRWFDLGYAAALAYLLAAATAALALIYARMAMKRTA